MKRFAVLLLLCVAGCLEPAHTPGPGPKPSPESPLAVEIREALKGDRQAAANYADLWAGMAELCASGVKLDTTEDVKRALLNGQRALGQKHTEALVPVITRELGVLQDSAPFAGEVQSRTIESLRRLAEAARKAAE